MLRVIEFDGNGNEIDAPMPSCGQCYSLVTSVRSCSGAAILVRPNSDADREHGAGDSQHFGRVIISGSNAVLVDSNGPDMLTHTLVQISFPQLRRNLRQRSGKDDLLVPAHDLCPIS